MELSPVMQKFILHWGEMGTRWGVNRTVAQIHALLYLSPDPLHAEEIAQTLSIARSNVSNSLKELQGWGIVKLVHVMGDRRDHFQSLQDVWELFRTVMEARFQREIHPTTLMIQECVDQSAGLKSEAHTHSKLKELLSFIQTMESFYRKLGSMPRAALAGLIGAGAGLGKLIGNLRGKS